MSESHLLFGSITPKKGNEMVQAVLEDAACNKNHEEQEYIMKWLLALQNPIKKPNVAIVSIGKPCVGKSVVASICDGAQLLASKM